MKHTAALPGLLELLAGTRDRHEHVTGESTAAKELLQQGP